MTKKCADEFEIQGTNNRYKHDAFFYTWCYEDSVFNKWMYDIKKNHYKLYIGYLFTEYECKYILPKIDPKHNELHVLKLHNVTKLNHDTVRCELNIETI